MSDNLSLVDMVLHPNTQMRTTALDSLSYSNPITNSTTDTSINNLPKRSVKTFNNSGSSYTNNTGGLGNYATYTDAYGNTAGISKDAYNAMNGTMDSSTGSIAVNDTGGTSYLKDYGGLALGGLNTGLAVYDTFLGTGGKIDKAKLKLLNQEYDINKDKFNREKNSYAKGLAAWGVA